MAGGWSCLNHISIADPFGLCDDPQDPKCKTLAQSASDAAKRTLDEASAAVSDGLAAIGRVVGLVDRSTAASVDFQAGNVIASVSADAIRLSLTPDIALSAVFNVGANWGGKGRMSFGVTGGEGLIAGAGVNMSGGKPSGVNFQAGRGWRPSPVDLKLSGLVTLAQSMTVTVGSQKINP